MLIIINFKGFLDISCQIYVFPVDNVRASAGKITVCRNHSGSYHILIRKKLEEFQEDDCKIASNTEGSQMPSSRARDWLAQCEE